MEKDIIKELLESYKLDVNTKLVNAVYNMMQLGFDAMWLRNMTIIKDFDELYKTDTPVMEIYGDLSIKYKDLSVNHIRKIISERRLYEI
jgi:hypothetical protein